MSDHTTLTLMALPYAGMGVNVLVMAAIAHTTGKLSRAILGGIALGALTVGLGLFCPTVRNANLPSPEWISQTAVAYLTYFAYAFCFWTILNLNITSLRIRILREILSRPQQFIAEAELRQAYDPCAAMERRIERMIAGKQLTRNESGDYITDQKTVLHVARFLYTLRIIILPPQARR